MLRHVIITVAILLAASVGTVAGEIHDAARDGDLYPVVAAHFVKCYETQ